MGKDNVDRYALETGALPHPHGLILLQETAYLVDGGELVALSLENNRATRLAPPGGLIEGFPVGEIIYPALGPDGESILLLDKRGDLYRYDPATGHWSVERPIDRRRSAPNPVPRAVDSYNERVYLLDSNYSQIWRHPYGEGVSEGYLPGGDAPSNRSGSALDITLGIDLAVYDDVYVLLRESGNEPAGLVRFVGAPADRDGGFGAPPLDRPTRLFLDPNGEGPLYVIDREGYRLRLLDRETGAVLQTLTAAVEMRALYARAGRLYIATADALYLYPGSGQTVAITGGIGSAERPDDPRRLASLPSLSPPIEGVRFMPERESLIPGSPRVYRYGIHHGLDMYGDTMGTAIPYGTPVLAPAAGVVVRADHVYTEITEIEWGELSNLCEELHTTPPEVEERYRGRQVWIDHGDGVVTHYAHLAGIPEEIVPGTVVARGQVIGFVGNSGTLDGVTGSRSGAHLHFEIFVDGHYLGEWLSLLETRRLLQRILFP